MHLSIPSENVSASVPYLLCFCGRNSSLARPCAPIKAMSSLLPGAFAPKSVTLGKMISPVPVATVDFKNVRLVDRFSPRFIPTTPFNIRKMVLTLKSEARIRQDCRTKS